MVQGIISSLKESFGFIERADVVAEIFFHYSEFNGDINEVMIGDDVEFHLQDRQVSSFFINRTQFNFRVLGIKNFFFHLHFCEM